MSATMGAIDLSGPAPVPDRLLDTLADEVRRVCEQPINVLQVAALLETAGITDHSAWQRYGHASVFDLAQSVVRRISRPVTSPAAPVLAPPEGRWQAAMDYLRGPLTLLPMVLLSALIVIYQEFGQWPAARVLAFSVSLVGSLLVTSGFVQAASRKGSSYLSQGYVVAARRIVSIIAGIGLAAVCLAAAALALAALVLLAAPLDVVVTMAVAFVVLSCLWLAAGVLFMLNQVHWFGLGLATGVGLIYALLHGLAGVDAPRGWQMLAATAAGFVAALLVMLAAIRRTLAQRLATSPVGSQHVVLPALPHLVVGLTPYFLYGVLYVLLVLAGHVTGWLGRTPPGVERMTAVTSTEIGLTIALGGAILAGGVAERTIARFWRLVKIYQLEASPWQPGQFCRSMATFHSREQRRFMLVVALCSALVSAGALAGATWMRGRGLALLPWDQETQVVLALGVAGYGIMTLGVFQCMFMITLSRPGMAVQAVAVGIVVTLAAGLAIGQATAYQYSAWGIVLGSLVFVAVAYRNLRRLMAHSDYFYFASF